MAGLATWRGRLLAPPLAMDVEVTYEWDGDKRLGWWRGTGVGGDPWSVGDIFETSIGMVIIEECRTVGFSRYRCRFRGSGQPSGDLGSMLRDGAGR